MEYFLHILIIIAIYTVLAVSYDLIAGHTGLLSVCHAAFFGLGAYVSALLTIRYHTGFSTGMLAGMIIAALFSLLISIPSLRLRGDFFLIATFGFQMIMFSIFNNWTDLTHGPLGIAGIPEPSFGACPIDSRAKFLFLASLLACIAYFVVYRVSVSPFGRVLHAIREDETLATARGKSTLLFKVSAFSISAVLAAAAGSLNAHYLTYIDPSGFTVSESIFVISIVIIGGAGSPLGPVVGAIILVTLPELLRLVGLPDSIAANIRQIIYGGALVALMLWRPKGLVGKYDFQKIGGRT